MLIDKQWSQYEVMNKEDDEIDGIDSPDMKDLRPVEIHFRIGGCPEKHGDDRSKKEREPEAQIYKVFLQFV
jgi:hypothetical protein